MTGPFRSGAECHSSGPERSTGGIAAVAQTCDRQKPWATEFASAANFLATKSVPSDTLTRYRRHRICGTSRPGFKGISFCLEQFWRFLSLIPRTAVAACQACKTLKRAIIARLQAVQQCGASGSTLSVITLQIWPLLKDTQEDRKSVV